MYNDIYLQDDTSGDHLSIDLDDLFIVDKDPPYEVVLAYAKKLGFDIMNDPPELLAIAKKYLLIPPPENIIRAFLKETLEILYINQITEEILLTIDLDDMCKKEYEKEKKKLKEKKKKGKKKKKKSSKDSSANEEEYEKEIKENKKYTEKDKKKLIIKKKSKLREYKDKIKMKYIKNKTQCYNAIQDEYNIKIILEKSKLKTDLENDIIKPLENKLKQDYDTAMEKYEKELKGKLEKDLNNDNINKEYKENINNLNNKIKELQNEIKKQKAKKDEKIKEEKIKIEKEINIKEKEFNNKLNSKRNELNKLNEQKISKIKNEFNDKYETYIEKYKKNNMYYNNYKNISYNIQENPLETKEKYNLILKEANEIFEQNKLDIKEEFEKKLNKDLSSFKNDKIQENKKKSEDIKKETFNLEKKYNEELENLIKNQKESKNFNIYTKEIDNIINKINVAYTSDKMNKGINDFLSDIKRIIFDEEKVEELIENKNNELYFKSIKIKSFYDISEKEYIKNFNEIDYYKEMILLIIKSLYDKNENKEINDELIINDLMKKGGDRINKYKEKFKDEVNNKLFPLLDKQFDKFNKTNKLNNKQKGNIFNNSLLNKKSFYEQSSKNAINTTIILDNFKNAVFNTYRNNKNKSILNNINNSSLNNRQLNSFRNVSSLNKKPFLSNNNINSLKNVNDISNNLDNNNNFNKTYINQDLKTFRLNNRNQNESNAFIYMMSNDIKPDNNNNLNNNLKFNELININKNNNVNLELNNIEKLNENIKDNLSQENNDIYNRIHAFFNEEYNSLNEKMNDLNKSNYLNNQINTLRESAQLKRYRNIFSHIYEKEQKKLEDTSQNIFQSKNNLDKIRKNCNFLFNQINSGLMQHELIDEKFKNIIEDINNYKNNKKYNIDYLNNNINNNQLRKSISMDNRINNNNRYKNNRYNLYKANIQEEKKQDDDNYINNYSSFSAFCNSYEPFYLSEKINNNFSHNFFNFKKNYGDIKFKLISSKFD